MWAASVNCVGPTPRSLPEFYVQPLVRARDACRRVCLCACLCVCAPQIVIAWHDEGYWLGDVKPSNFVVDVAHSPPVLYAIDFESVVCFTASPHWQLATSCPTVVFCWRTASWRLCVLGSHPC